MQCSWSVTTGGLVSAAVVVHDQKDHKFSVRKWWAIFGDENVMLKEAKEADAVLQMKLQ